MFEKLKLFFYVISPKILNADYKFIKPHTFKKGFHLVLAILNLLVSTKT